MKEGKQVGSYRGSYLCLAGYATPLFGGQKVDPIWSPLGKLSKTLPIFRDPYLPEISDIPNPETVRPHSSNSDKNATPLYYSQSSRENATPSGGTSLLPRVLFRVFVG